MADTLKKIIIVDAETQTAESQLNDLNTAFESISTSNQKLTAQIDEQNKLINKTTADTKKGLEAGSKGTKGLADGFKAIGTSIKAAGIGLVLAAIAAIFELLKSNQSVLDGFSASFKGLNIIFNDFVNLVSNNTDKIKGFFKEAFSIEGLKNFGKAIVENVQERLVSYIDTLGLLSKGVGQLFTGDFKKALDTFKAAGKESIDILTGVDDTVDKTVEGVNKLVDATGKYLSNVYDQAKAMVALENRAKIATAQNAKLIELYDRQAEKQRQLRDDESSTINARLSANSKLGEILEKQANAMSANAALGVQQAKNDLSLNNNIDNRIKLIEAETQAAGILAQVEGFRSEQIVNRIALEKEANELNQTIIDGDIDRAKIERDFSASRIKDDIARLYNQRVNLEDELQIETDRLTQKRDLYNEGTQAYEDANQELLNKQVEINNAIISNDDARTVALKKLSDDRIAREKAESEQKLAIQNAELDALANGVNIVGQFAGKNKALQKASIVAENAIGIAKIVVNTQAANAGAIAKYSLIPGGQALAAAEIAANKISAGIGIATTVAATAKALSAIGGGGSSSGSGGGVGGSGPTAPVFNTVGASGTNQLSRTIADQQNVPVRAYVTSQDITTQQQLDRNILNSSTFIG